MSSSEIDRRDVLKLMGVGGVVFASGLAGAAGREKKSDTHRDFLFLQLSDTHWGYSGAANPEAATTLEKTVATINSVATRPDFIIFTGDLTHNTDDAAERAKRLKGFRDIASGLAPTPLRFIPGEHDAAKDGGRAYRDQLGATHYAFDHKGVHFIALDNVSDPAGAVGAGQIDWLASDLSKLDREAPIVVFAHRPLFDLYPEWDWKTEDGAKVVDLLLPHKHVTVFYGHIHQEHHHRTEHIAHHAARSLVFPLPAPGAQPKKAPLPWDPAAPFQGLGYRQITLDARRDGGAPRIEEEPVMKKTAT